MKKNKKILLLGLCVTIMLSICACGQQEQTKEPEEEIVNIEKQETVKWDNYELTVSEQGISLPMSYEKFQKMTNCQIENAEELVVEKDAEIEVKLFDQNENVLGIAKLFNTQKETQSYDKCEVIALTQTNDTTGQKFVFAGGLKVGDKVTQEKLRELFGEPDDIAEGVLDEELLAESGSHHQHQWLFAYHADDPYMDNTYEIKVSAGTIYSIKLDRIGLYTANIN